MESKRALKALGLFALLSLVFSGTVGFATAAVSDPDVLIPEPRPGDSAYYLVREVIDDPGLAKGTVPYDWARLTWEDEKILPDESGKPQPFQPARFELMFRQGTQYQHLNVRTSYYDPYSGAAVMDEYSGDGYYTTGGGLLALGGGYSDADYTSRSARGPAGMCGADTPLHGAMEAPETMEVHGYCRDFTLMGDEPTTHYTLVGHTVWQDRDAVVYEDVDGLQLTYAEGVPFPVIVEAPLSEFIYEPYRYGRHFSLELHGFERADTDYPVRGPRILDDPLPLVPRVPVTQIDETGMTGFTLAQAYQAALADTQSPRLADFMDRPGTYIGAAWKNQFEDADGNIIQRWNLIATDGDNELGKVVEEEFMEYALDLPLEGTAPPQYSVDDYGQAAGVDFPPQSRLPAQIPSLTAAMARSTAYEGVETPNLWGFYANCHNAGCTDVKFAVRTGEEHFPAESPSIGTEGNAPASQYTIFFAQDGMLSHTWAFQAESGSEPVIPLASATTVPRNDDGAQGDAVWLPPSAPAAASVGFLAVLGAVVYYFWPGLKVGFVGLFSRIRDDKVLDHPLRRRIHDAIQADPGIHFQELARRVECGRGTLEHHLRKLAEARLVVRQEGKGVSCYFPRGAVDRRVMEVTPLLRADSTRSVLDAVAASPGTTCAEISQSIGLTTATISYHLGKLRKAGLVGTGRTLHLTPDGFNALAAAGAA